MTSYIEVISTQFPNVIVSAFGDGSVYANLVADPSGAALPSQVDLDAAKLVHIRALMWAKIQAERDRRTQGGVLVSGNWFHSDQPSRIQQLGLVIMGAGLPAGIMWKTMGGGFVEMTQTLAGQIFQAVAAKDMAVFSAAEQHKGAMSASSTPETYNMFNGSPVWPAIYGE